MSTYFYLIDTNNRGDLVEEIFKKRFNWKPLRKTWTAIQENKWNFIWKTTVNFTPSPKGINYKLLKPYLQDGKANLFSLFSFPSSLSKDKKGKKIINHFPNPDSITRKTELVRSLKYKAEFLPETYILNFRDGPNEFLKNYTPEDIWILKPEYLHSGQKIKMFDNLENIVQYFETELVSAPESSEWVIQKYIRNPFLIEGRKFDIRINVLVTKNFDIYVNPHGFIRTVSDKYVPYLDPSKSELENRLIHITNHSVQKLGKNYGLREEGNVMSLLQFQTYLDLTYGKNVISVYRDFFPQWIEIVREVVLKGLNKFNTQDFKNVEYFEMFGFDFIIDELGKSWLLEVNTNPGLEQDNSWAIHIVRDMLEGLAEICIDPYFPSKKLAGSKLLKLPPKNLHWEAEIQKQSLPPKFLKLSERKSKPLNLSVPWNKI